MEIIFLGTGTSQGIPVIGCSCSVCQSTDPRDNRLRVAVLLRKGNQQIVIDAGPDFRQQMLRARVTDLNAVLLTHEHNDHIIGLDDVRPFIFRQLTPMPIYCDERVAGELRERFAYAFAEDPYPGAPRFELHPTNQKELIQIGDFDIGIIRYLHGRLPIQGYRIGNFAYLTDIKRITDKELEKLDNLQILVISALHHEDHHSHLKLKEALALIKRINPQQAYLTHLSHKMGTHQEVEKLLPKNVCIAYDQLALSLDN
ncbi:MAG: MBL fold metallo-hydrolase [Lewinella sp.]|jgi:phosphoribosyl 1,2-cyclic phosphate phosphodiesterase|uniref:MBL fold metallo-hydrolase n=1 Tax=Lewinella sp. TaxID=2004506 RepID=UPI003D6C4D52